jgi:hypothetical protein
MIFRAEETVRVAASSRNLKGMNIKILRDAANSIAAGATKHARRAVIVCSTRATTMMDGWKRKLEETVWNKHYEIVSPLSFFIPGSTIG